MTIETGTLNRIQQAEVDRLNLDPIYADNFTDDSVANEQETEKSEITLSPGERDIFRLKALGKSHKEIAKILNLDASTVKNTNTGTLRKFDVGSSEEAVFKGAHLGLVDIEAALEGVDVYRVHFLSQPLKNVLESLTDATSFPGGIKGVAKNLKLAHDTIKNNLQNIKKRLGVESRITAGLAYIVAKKRGIL